MLKNSKDRKHLPDALLSPGTSGTGGVNSQTAPAAAPAAAAPAPAATPAPQPPDPNGSGRRDLDLTSFNSFKGIKNPTVLELAAASP